MPHPICHPAGHSFVPRAQRLPGLADLDPQRFADSTDYLFGIDLYNHGYFWEAATAFEACLRAVEADRGLERFFRALIQASAGQLKVRTGHLDGAASLTARASFLLRACAADHADSTGPFESGNPTTLLGIDVAVAARELDAYRHAVMETEPPGHDPRLFPYLRVVTGPRRLV